MLAMAEKFKLLYHVLGLQRISHTPRVPVALNAQRTIKIRTHNDVAPTPLRRLTPPRGRN